MKKRKIIRFILAIFISLCAACALLIWNGVILLNGQAAQKYLIKGIDVSSYQGEIKWEVLADQNIRFAFIKATEGSSYIDPNFTYNFTEAQKTKLRIGAYHFFSYDSKGEAQAENYIVTVPKTANMLPPVIDVEFYDDKEKNLPNKDETVQELHAMIDLLYEHYGLMPILYATEKSYRLYIANEFKDCDVWIRNVVSKPTLSDGRAWTFWQYTDKMHLKGYSGKEKFIDMNVFRGTEEDFTAYAK